MRLVLGVDEAGYGPNMGPLVIAVSAWVIDSNLDVLQGLGPLEPEFKAAPWTKQSNFVPLGDSKKIYHSGKGLSGLDFSIRFFESTIARSHRTEQTFFNLKNLASQDCPRVESQPWYNQKLSKNETEIQTPQLTRTLKSAQSKFDQLGLRLVDFQIRVIDEADFNASIERLGNKSDLLGQNSLHLVWKVLKRVLEFQPCESIEIYCDRQGGRKKYAGLLAHTLQASQPEKPIPFVTAVLESPHTSCYSILYEDRPLAIRFQVQGDSLFPPAASSLVAKWVRESLMQRLNQYWQELVGPTLRPTAGYAVDAARFAKDIQPWVAKLQLDENQWWRSR